MKLKFHFLLHLPAYIHHFGPAILFSTKHYESFNHIFCLSCIYSNHVALSQDTCNTFVAQDTMKHIATDGFWYDPHSKWWVLAGNAVLDHMAHPHIISFLGFHVDKAKNLGMWLENQNYVIGLILYIGVITLLPSVLWKGQRLQHHPPVSWNSTLCSAVTKAPPL